MDAKSNFLETIEPGPWTIKKFVFADGPDVDRSVWTSPIWHPGYNPSFLGRTALRNPTDFKGSVGCTPVKNGRAQLRLNTYNPIDPKHTSLLGAQINTIEKWGLSSYAKVAFHARVICPTSMPKGAVAALFAYNLIDQSADQRDEIDFELISKYWNDPKPHINTNVFLDSSQGTAVQNSIHQVFGNPIDLHIIWSSTGIQWLVNGVTVRKSSQAPQSDMSLTLNFWAPSAAGWTWAYDADLQPSNAPGQSWTFQVASASVSYVTL
ncbi:glycoside hydrolase family 16 protein [Pseudovibrio sp. Alg231-02]|uniref:glycoside hydrolase family 16 protein n=1 Tax=Pseudovibrio sp. Alg231-02 TaxID=1922223 RepID=UPI000D560DA5|nr:glycoside hydrolase family 16 protein [Pseudovibrio sp. Alg231-02]